jgi:hypothetical protein
MSAGWQRKKGRAQHSGKTTNFDQEGQERPERTKPDCILEQKDISKNTKSRALVAQPVIPATQEAEIRRIVVQSQPCVW